MGFPKQLLRLEGVSLLRRAALAAVASRCRQTLVILGFRAAELMTELEGLDIEIAQNERWEEGMGSSVRLAAKRALGAPDAPDALLFLTCDQPGVDAESINRLLSAAESSSAGMAAARYGDSVGVPAIFKRVHFEELADIQGERGAGPLLRKYEGSVVEVPLPEAALDVDTPEDWRRWS